jgi:4-hydroxy-tetrahydrodipicolinate synthase
MSSQVLIYPSGTHTVLVTPFDKTTKEIDFDAIQKWLAFQLNSLVTGIVLLGTTSETPTLSREEQLKVVKTIYEWNKTTDSPKFLTVGVGGNDTMETLSFARECVGICDAFMVTVPHYNKPTQRGILEHFKIICNHPETTNTPVIMYNIPSRTSLNAEPDTIKKIFNECKSVVAIKEASKSIDQLIKLRTIVPDLKVFSGDDKLGLDVMVHGGQGIISVASNVIPDIISYLVTYCLSGDFNKATKLYYDHELPQFIEALFCETNPIPAKFMLQKLNIFKTDTMRLPMTELSQEKHNIVLHALYSTVGQSSS